MSGQILWVPTDVFRRADVLLRGTSSGQAVKEGIELILKCDLSVAGEDPGPGLGRVDASGLLTKGLASLQNNPHEALGVPIGAKTQDIRKAYKKAALRYHPDKNPKTTPLFQVIQVACDKLSDREERAKAQKNAAANPISGRAEKFPVTRKDKSSQREPNGQNHQQQHEENLSRQYESIPQPRDNSEFEHYRATVNTDKAHNSHGFAKVQQDYHKQYKDTAKGARGHSDSSSEASKFRTDQRVTGVMQENFVDAKLAAMTETADQKQRSSDVTFEEEGRHHLKTDVVNAAATIIGTSIYDSSTTHSNNIQHPSSNHFAPESSYLHGISQKVPRAQVATQLPDSAKAVEPGGLSRQEKSLPAPGLKSVNSRFHSQQANNDHHIQPNGKRILVPLPVDLKAVNVTYSSVELEWKISDQFATPILIQLSWRKQIVNASWERATQLINGLKCKKNNLELSPDLGCTYEFRIRAIEDLPGGMLGDRSDWSESVFVRKCAEKSIKNPSSSTNSKILKSVEKTATTHEQTGTPAVAHSEAPVHVTDSTLNSQYQHIFERPERFRTNTLPKKISEIKSGSENSSTSSLSSSLSSFHSTILSPLSLSPTDALSPKNKLSSNRKTLNLPAATTGEKSSNCHYPSHIHQEEIKDMKSSLHNCQPSSTSISSSSNMVSDSNERVEYTPCSSTATSRATTAVVNPVSPQVGRRRSVFVKRKGVDNNIDKVKATDKNHGKNISQSDVESGSGSIDRRVVKNDDESIRYRHRSSRKASEWKSFQGSNSSSSSLCTADIAAVFPQFNTNKSAESENMKISSLNQSNSSARQAWGGINGSLRRSMKSSSSISDVEGKEIIEDGLYTSSAVVSNDNDDDDDDDDDYSDDMEIEEDEEANILEYKNHSQKSNELTDDEIGEEEPVVGLATLKMGRRKSSIYVPTNEKNGNWRRDPENISKENRKNISPSHRIRTKKEDKKRFHLSGSSNTSFRGDIDKNVGRYREKEDEIKKEEVIDEENGEDKDSLQEKLYELIPPKGINNYEHPVRIEPTHGSTIIGYLLPGTCIVALAVAGIWGKVQCHKKVREIDVKSVRSTRKESDICGWCLLKDITNKHLFLKSNEVINEDIEDEEEINKLQKISKSYNKKSDVNDLQGDIKKSEKTALLNKVKKVIKQDVQPIEKNVRVNNIDTWQEMFDDEGGYAYFYNSSTGETSWEAPEWVEETDPESGSKYYLRLNTSDGNPLQSTWTEPVLFSKLVRQNHS